MHSIPFSAGVPADFFLQFPTSTAVFALLGESSAEPYVAKTANLRKRLLRLLAPPEFQSRRLNLRERVVKIEYSLTGSDFESAFLLYKLLRHEFPEAYSRRLRLRPAALIKLNLENSYPRAYVTTKIGRRNGRSRYFGPFRSRAIAEKFLNDSLDLFRIRRCTFDLHPDPAFPGCVYSEMKMCLAPCFQGCTDEAYAAEVKQVQTYFESGGESYVHALEVERDRLSACLDFEAAAQLHTRIGKVKSVLSSCDEIFSDISLLHALIVQPSPYPDSVMLFRFRSGSLGGPEIMPVPAQQPTAIPGEESWKTGLRAVIDKLVPGKISALQAAEELAILKRWYYRSHKAGEIVFISCDQNQELPVRKIINAVNRVYRAGKQCGDKPAPPEHQSSPPTRG